MREQFLGDRMRTLTLGTLLIVAGVITLVGAGGLWVYDKTRPQAASEIVPVPTSPFVALIQPTATNEPESTSNTTARRPTATATARVPTATAQAIESVTPESGTPEGETASPTPSSTPAAATIEPTATAGSAPPAQPPPETIDPPAQEAPFEIAEIESEVTHVSVPAAGVDADVVEVDYELIELGDQTVIKWNVAQWAAGHHSISSNPGDGSNVVLAAHVAGYGDVFRNLEYAATGDEVILTTLNGEYRYRITEIHLRLDLGVPLEERLATGAFMDPTSSERVTLVTCWPYDVYDHRLIVIAEPV